VLYNTHNTLSYLVLEFAPSVKDLETTSEDCQRSNLWRCSSSRIIIAPILEEDQVYTDAGLRKSVGKLKESENEDHNMGFLTTRKGAVLIKMLEIIIELQQRQASEVQD
jgi:hypothetical protein